MAKSESKKGSRVQKRRKERESKPLHQGKILERAKRYDPNKDLSYREGWKGYRAGGGRGFLCGVQVVLLKEYGISEKFKRGDCSKKK